MKKITILFLIIIFVTLSVHRADAASISLAPMPATIAQQQQFYVDVTIDPQGISFNGIQGAVSFSSDTLSFVRAETGSSSITYFIDQPTVKGNTVTFSGIIPGGFDGLINPFDPVHKKPGEVMRLVFVGKAAGTATIGTSHMQIAGNDGQGTLQPVPDQQFHFVVSNTVAPSVYSTPDTVMPVLSASIVSDKDLYDGKYTLVFTAVDKQSGIDHVEIKEGTDAWQTIQSPYVLRDQSRQGILLIRAVDAAGNATLVTINAAPQSSRLVLPILLILFLLSIVLYVIKKKYTQRVL